MLLSDLKEMNSDELIHAEHDIDRLFNQLGLDVVFTQHFKNRVLNPDDSGRRDTDLNSKARDTDVSEDEIVKAFAALKSNYGKLLLKARNNPEEFVGILKDITTKLNIPFAIDYDKIYKGLHKLYATTIMRKNNFRPNSIYDKILPVKS